MPATTDSCERSCSRSRPRRTATRNLSRFVSSVASMPSAQSSISRRISRALRRASSMISCASPLANPLPRLPLGQLDDLRLRGLAHRLLARLLEEAILLSLRLGKHLLPLLDDPPGLLDLLGDRRPHLVEDVVDLLTVDADLVGQGHGLRVVHEVVELVAQTEDVHRPFSLLLVGQRSATSPVREHLLQTARDGLGH